MTNGLSSATDSRATPRTAIFGLGEAGWEFAHGLAACGFDVHAYDPNGSSAPEGVSRHDDAGSAVLDADLVLALTSSADAETALTQALDQIPTGALYADLSTSAAHHKRHLGAIASRMGLGFADVGLLAPVPERGVRTPQLVSGDGATRYAEILGSVGAPVTHVGDQPGDAATRKLLRSIVTKGLAALMIEALEAARATNLQDWMWDHLGEFAATMDDRMIRRLVDGTPVHARRRYHEMVAVADLLQEVGVDPVMTRGTIEGLRRLTESPASHEDPTPGESA